MTFSSLALLDRALRRAVLVPCAACFGVGVGQKMLGLDRAMVLRKFCGKFLDPPFHEGGLIDYDQKTLMRLWEDYCADMPAQIRARAMMGEL